MKAALRARERRGVGIGEMRGYQAEKCGELIQESEKDLW